MSQVCERAGRPSGSRGLIIRIDVHFAPALAVWMSSRFGIEARPVTRLGLLAASDHAVFHAARDAGAHALLTKDADFSPVVRASGIPSAIVLASIGKCSNQQHRALLDAKFERALSQIRRGVPLVEVAHVVKPRGDA